MAAELLALDSSRQSAFTKAVKKIKKSIATKKGKNDVERYARGIILVQHLPYGFFEDELRGFFSQFGKVMRVRLGRSKKTGRSKGYAFVEFEFEEVAKIAAESMNNYLMFERLIKCELLPPGQNAKRIFYENHVREDNYPQLKKRKEIMKLQSVPMEEEEVGKVLNARLNKVVQHNKRLAELGIDYQFGAAHLDLKKETPKKRRIEENIAATPRMPISKEEEVTPAQKIKFSPRILRSRGRPSIATNDLTAIKIEFKQKEKIRPQGKQIGETKITIKEKPKFSPKLLRSRTRQSEGPITKPLTPANARGKQRKSIR